MKRNENNIVIYTAIYNDYDDLRDPETISLNCDYICFTDNPKLESKVWKIKYLPQDDLDPTRKNRRVKILPHLFFSDYKYSVYVDGSLDIIGNIEKLVEKYLVKRNHQLAAFGHPSHNCLYKEAKKCIEKGKDNEEIINKQIQRYRKEGMPLNYGLIQNRVLLRKHNDQAVIKTMEDWWQEVLNHSRRDQISFCYSAWKNNFKYTIIDGIFKEENNFFKLREHKKTGLKKIWQTVRMNQDKNRFYALLHAWGRFILRSARKLRF
jgi:hypothetical protein